MVVFSYPYPAIIGAHVPKEDADREEEQWKAEQVSINPPEQANIFPPEQQLFVS